MSKYSCKRRGCPLCLDGVCIALAEQRCEGLNDIKNIEITCLNATNPEKDEKVT